MREGQQVVGAQFHELLASVISLCKIAKCHELALNEAFPVALEMLLSSESERMQGLSRSDPVNQALSELFVAIDVVGGQIDRRHLASQFIS